MSADLSIWTFFPHEEYPLNLEDTEGVADNQYPQSIHIYRMNQKLSIIKLTPPVWNSAAVYSPQRGGDKIEITEPTELEKLDFKSQPTRISWWPLNGQIT